MENTLNSLIYFILKIIRRIICRKKFGEKKNKGKYFEKIPKSFKFGGKIPESREKLPGFSNPKNLRTLFFQSNLLLGVNQAHNSLTLIVVGESCA
jgi:hypothetical protein